MTDQYLDLEEESTPEVGIESILDQLLEIIAAAKSMPLSSSVMVSREGSDQLVAVRPREHLPARRVASGPLVAARKREEFLAERTP